MSVHFYTGDGRQQRPDTPVNLPVSPYTQLTLPQHYYADPGLVDACNVALLLGQPLLLTGEPGTGKTQFVYNLAWELGYDLPLKFDTKSTSVARDLFYTHDTLRRFQDAQSGVKSSNALPYLTYQALGAAILRTLDYEDIVDYVPGDFVHNGKERSIVLIDEIDKAPRDFPNDLLNELEQAYFHVPELKNIKIEANPELRPVVVITSNSEKDLPDAFLRRCIYYNIPFPERDRLLTIATNRLQVILGKSESFLKDALDLFYELRDPAHDLRKKPTTAELLGWLIALHRMKREQKNPFGDLDLILRTLSNLVKTAEDQERAAEIVKRWLNS